MAAGLLLRALYDEGAKIFTSSARYLHGTWRVCDRTDFIGRFITIRSLLGMQREKAFQKGRRREYKKLILVICGFLYGVRTF